MEKDLLLFLFVYFMRYKIKNLIIFNFQFLIYYNS